MLAPAVTITLESVAILTLIVVAVAIPSFLVWKFRSANAMLDVWLAERNYRLARRHRCGTTGGPWVKRTSLGQVVYRVVVVDHEGNRRSGWLRVGSALFGLWAYRADAWWDEEPRDVITQAFPVVQPSQR